MALQDCLGKLLSSESLTKSQAENIAERAAKLKNIYRNSGKYSEVDLQTKAEQDALASMFQEVKDAKFREALQISKLKKRTVDVQAHRGGQMKGVRAELQKTENLGDAVYSQAVFKMYDFVEKFRSKVGGGIDRLFTRKNNALMRDVSRALHGDTDVSPESRHFADMFKGAQDYLFDRINRAGIRKHKLENFGVRHNWDIVKLKGLGKERFTSDIIPKLDRTRMVDSVGQPLDNAKIKSVIDDTYDTIMTGGLNKSLKAGKAVQKGSSTIKTRAAASRVLHFKSGSSWLDMHDKYGLGDLYENMLDGLKKEAQDIAIVERFGPNPDTVFNMLDSSARLSAKTDKAGSKTFAVRNNQGIWNLLTGRSEGVINPVVAEAMSTMRNFMASAKLGKAVIASIADQAHLAKEISLWNGSYVKLVGRMLKQLKPGGKENRALAARMGLGLEWAHSRALAANRFTEMDSIGKFSRLGQSAADFTIRTTGLASLTRAGREAFGIELNGLLASKASQSFTELSSKVSKGLTFHGIDTADWDVIRKSIMTVRGSKFIDIEKLTKTDESLASKYLAMTHAEMRLAVPEPDIAIRGAITGGAAKGGLRREVGATIGQFKGFPITVLVRSAQQILFDPRLGGKMSRGIFGAKLAIFSTLMGAAALQLRAVADGKDLLDHTSPDFWGQAVVMGGAFGLVGDLLERPPTTPGAAASQVVGPVGGLVTTVVAAMGSNAMKLREGEDTTVGRDLARLAGQNVPGKLFYTQLAIQRFIFDQLESMVDSKASKRWKRYQKRLKNRTGQEYFWKQGEAIPGRAPKIAEDK